LKKRTIILLIGLLPLLLVASLSGTAAFAKGRSHRVRTHPYAPSTDPTTDAPPAAAATFSIDPTAQYVSGSQITVILHVTCFPAQERGHYALAASQSPNQTTEATGVAQAEAGSNGAPSALADPLTCTGQPENVVAEVYVQNNSGAWSLGQANVIAVFQDPSGTAYNAVATVTISS
jgi:hypothetical protein